jgi:hypothetical protein
MSGPVALAKGTNLMLHGLMFEVTSARIEWDMSDPQEGKQTLVVEIGLARDIGTVCARCGEAPGDRAVVTVQAGGWLHKQPCWEAALDEATERSVRA